MLWCEGGCVDAGWLDVPFHQNRNRKQERQNDRASLKSSLPSWYVRVLVSSSRSNTTAPAMNKDDAKVGAEERESLNEECNVKS